MNILVLFPRTLYERKMSIVRRAAIREMVARSDITAKLSGPGWPDWQDGAPLAANIDRVMQAAQIIWWYKPLGSNDSPPMLSGGEKPDLPAVMCFNEAWWSDQQAFKECESSGTSLVIAHHQADLFNLTGPWELAWIPHGAPHDLFTKHAKPFAERTVSILATGCQSPEIYPLRTRVAGLIESGKIPGKVRPHPGYRLGGEAECDRQAEEYAAAMGDAKIVACCSSKHEYGLAKYPEAALSGAVVAGDLPVDFLPLKRSMILLSPQDSDSELAGKLLSALASDRLPIMAAECQATAIARYTTGRYVHLLIDRMRRHLAGRRVR